MVLNGAGRLLLRTLESPGLASKPSLLFSKGGKSVGILGGCSGLPQVVSHAQNKPEKAKNAVFRALFCVPRGKVD